MKGKILFILSLSFFLFVATLPKTVCGQPKALPTKAAVETPYDFKSMTTYEMFWPVVPGKIPGDQFYGLKVWRDKLVGSLFFSGFKKAEYFKQIANKRLVEAERLLEVKRLQFFPETINQSLDNLEKGLKLFSSLSPSQDQAWLREEYVKDLEKYTIVFERMADQTEGEQKDAVNKAIVKIGQLTADLPH